MPANPARRSSQAVRPHSSAVSATRAVDLPITRPRTIQGLADAVVIDKASVRFDDQLAVDEVSFTVPSGTILGLIGPSGAGKTTTIRLLTGALEPTSGSVTVLDENPRSFTQRTRSRLGYMPQALTLFADLTCKENVDFVGSLFGMVFRSRRRRTREALFDGDLLGDLPIIRDVRQVGPRRLRITVDDAGSATPDFVEAVERLGGQFGSAREERPSFDEVFARLVERDRSRTSDERPGGSDR